VLYQWLTELLPLSNQGTDFDLESCAQGEVMLFDVRF
jgi:hypothetical protein